MKKVLCVFGIVLTVFAAIIITIAVMVHVSLTRHPFLRQTEEEIRAYMLELTPVGMSMDEARIVLEQRFQVEEWAYGLSAGRAFVDYENGLVLAFIPSIHAYPPPDIGVNAIGISLGSYRPDFRLLSHTHVYAGWGFDENGRLIDVYISKGRPAL